VLTFSFILISIIGCIGFCIINTLPKIKVIPLWLFILLSSGLLFNSISSNLGYIKKPMNPDPYLTYILLQYIVVPLAFLTIMNLYRKPLRPLKVFAALMCPVILSLGEVMVERLGVMLYIEWNFGLSLLLWYSLTFMVIVFYHFIDLTVLKKVGSHV
jgi:hypothetical protein